MGHKGNIPIAVYSFLLPVFFKSRRLYDADNLLTSKITGYAIQEYEYAGDALVSDTYWNERHELCENSYGYARREIEWVITDSKSGKDYTHLSVAFYGADRLLCVPSFLGAAKVSYTYYEDGAVHQVTCTDEGGNLCNADYFGGAAVIEGLGWNGLTYEVIYWRDKDLHVIDSIEDPDGMLEIIAFAIR